MAGEKSNTLNIPLILVYFLLILFFVILGLFIWLSTKEDNGYRVLLTFVFHVGILFTGWLVGKWVGLLLISLPLLLFYYYFLIHIALVVMPASRPGVFDEWMQRIRFFIFYTWGMQYPAWVVPGPAARIAEVRIKGDQYNRGTAPGFVWAYSHQVVGITTGITFSRIEAPGTVFTNAFERPIDGVVDLRTQLRTFWVDVVSSDGIPYKALLFTSFVVDREPWDRGLLARLKHENRLLKDAGEPDYQEGSFPISRLRIRTLLSATGIRSAVIGPIKKVLDNKVPAKKDGNNKGPAKKEAGKKEPVKKEPIKKEPTKTELIYWDELVMYHIEKAASEVLSQKRFDEIWLPEDDAAGKSAGDAIAAAIKDHCSFNLLCQGVRFFSCRLVNFEFEREKLQQPGEVELQQITAWQADWQRDTIEIRAQGKADAELARQDARAFAYASLLTAIAEGLQGTNQLDPDLSKNLVAMRFVGALEDILQQQPEGDDKKEASSAINTWKRRLGPGLPRQ